MSNSDKQRLNWNQSPPAERMARLTERLKHIELVKSLLEQPGWRELESHLRATINRKHKSRDSLNEDDPPEKFLAHRERSTYMTGWIQGASWVLNDVNACLQEESDIRKQIKELEAELKGVKRARQP